MIKSLLLSNLVTITSSSKIVENLTKALPYVANETQEKLLKYYIESFSTGSMNAQSQIEWVKDLKPEVESNIGFIET